MSGDGVGCQRCLLSARAATAAAAAALVGRTGIRIGPELEQDQPECAPLSAMARSPRRCPSRLDEARANFIVARRAHRYKLIGRSRRTI